MFHYDPVSQITQDKECTMKVMLRISLLIVIALMAALSGVEVKQDRQKTVISVVRDGEHIFEYKFETSQHIYTREESPSGHYLLVWHMDTPPRRLKIFRLTDGVMVSDFVPGFGGRLQWTYGDKILHSWGCGTDCQFIRVYDIAGGVLHEESVTDHLLTPRGYYVVYPALKIVDQAVYTYNVNTGEKTVVLESPPCTRAHYHLEETDLIISCPGDDEIRIPLE